MRLLTFLLFCSLAFAQSSSPETGNSASVVPSFTVGHTGLIFVSALVGRGTPVTLSDTGSPQQTYLRASKPVGFTGVGQFFYIQNMTADLIGQTITAQWSAEGSNLAPIITFYDPGFQGVETMHQAYSTQPSTESITSGEMFAFDPATFIFCAAAGDTPMSDWMADVTNGWEIPDGATTDHSGCAVLATSGEYMGTTFLSWTGEGLQAYSVEVGFRAVVPSKHIR